MEPPSSENRKTEDPHDDHTGKSLQASRSWIPLRSKQHNDALKEAAELAFSVSNSLRLEKWSNYPEAMRNNPICVIEALRSEKGRLIQLSDIPHEMLQNNREVKLEALKSGLLEWSENCRPTREEWRDCKILSRLAIRNLKAETIPDFQKSFPKITKDV